MRSVSQLAYLQALDIPALVSRRDLPGAAPTQRMQLARTAPRLSVDSTGVLATGVPATGVPATGAPAAGAPDLASLSAGLKRSVADKAPAANAAKSPESVAAAPKAGTPVFSVAATLAGGWYWLDEIPSGREPGEEYGQLLLAICRALGWSQEPARMERFSYPVAAGLAGGVGEAREALQGFLNGRLSRLSPAGVILMGDLDQPWFDRGCFEEQRVVQTVSAWQMLRDASLKRQAWSDLKGLRGDG